MIIFGTKGNDIIPVVSDQHLLVKGRAGDDDIDASGSTSGLYIRGGSGRDLLTGGGGNDSIHGGRGADTISGGAGFDYLTGGPGGDVFAFEPGMGIDNVSDFKRGADKIAISFDLADVTFYDGVLSYKGEAFAYVAGMDDFRPSDFIEI